MQTKCLITVNELCAKHDIEVSFISSLEQSGLIEIITVEESGYVDADQLRQLEKCMGFYYDLDINLAGIETITHLLQRIEILQDEISVLRNRLRFYE
ncbi:MAG: chaperone modulator CbpM [Bacteroidales bacterium]|nr:chaperone modulator CbpM [Bacteroidales bacterium]